MIILTLYWLFNLNKCHWFIYSATFATPESLFYIQEVGVDGVTDEFGPFQLGVAFGAYMAPDRIDPGEGGPTLYLPWVVAR